MSPSLMASKISLYNAYTLWNSNAVKYTDSTLSLLAEVSNKGLLARASFFRSHPSTNSFAPSGLFRFHRRQRSMSLSLSPCHRLEIPRLRWCISTEQRTKHGLASMLARFPRQTWRGSKGHCVNILVCSTCVNGVTITATFSDSPSVGARAFSQPGRT